jgi:hypothetical protein
MTALFSANKGEWFTPPEIIKRVHAVMGGIDLDPASCAQANEIVGAKEFWTDDDNSLNRAWHGRVFVNPPGTCTVNPTKVEVVYKDGEPKVKRLPGYFMVCENANVCSCDLPRKFWNKLMMEFHGGRVSCAVYLGFSLNQLATLQTGNTYYGCTNTSPVDFPLCILRERLRFLDSETLEPVPGPTCHNFVSYVNGSGMKFRAEFSSLGACK